MYCFVFRNIMENSEDVYEFKCSKDEGRGEEDEDKTAAAAPPRPDAGQPEDKGDKRGREGETEEDEEARKKRRKEEVKDAAVKGVGRGGGRPTGKLMCWLNTAVICPL